MTTRKPSTDEPDEPSRGPWLCHSAALGLLCSVLVTGALARAPLSEPFFWFTWGFLPASLVSLAFPWLGQLEDKGVLGAKLPLLGPLLLLGVTLIDAISGYSLPAWLLTLCCASGLALAAFPHMARLAAMGPIARIRAPGLGIALALFAAATARLAVSLVADTQQALPWLYLASGLLMPASLIFYLLHFAPDQRQDGEAPKPRPLSAYPDARRFFLVTFLLGAAAALLPAGIETHELPAPFPALNLFSLGLVAAFGAGALAMRQFTRNLGGKRTLALSLLLLLGLGIAKGFAEWRVELLLVFFAAAYLNGLAAAALGSLSVRFSPPERAGAFTGFFFAALAGGLALGQLGLLTLPSHAFWMAIVCLLAGAICLQYVDKSRATRLARGLPPEVAPTGSVTLEELAEYLRGNARHTAASRLLQYLARQLAEIFFGKVRVQGIHHVHDAANSGAILVANHPNTFLDPLLITAIWPGRLRYWAKSTLWKLPVLGTLLDHLGAIPVYRRQDHPNHPEKANLKTMRIAAGHLAESAHILIFPEGVSEIGLSLRPIKTGSARLAFQTAEQTNGQVDTPLIPVGIDYAEPTIFRTAVTISIGEPLRPSAYREQYERDPREAVRELTLDIGRRLRRLTPHLEAPELEALVGQVLRLYGERLLAILNEDDETQARKRVVEAINHYNEADPEALRLFAERLENYFTELDRLRTPENHEPIPTSRLLAMVRGLFSFTTLGMIGNWPPYRLTGALVERLTPEPVWQASAKLAIGTLTFGAYYALLGFVTRLFLGPLSAVMLLSSLMISGTLALGALERYAFRVRRLKAMWQAFWTQDTTNDLEAMKLSLIQDLERFRESYAFFISQLEDPRELQSHDRRAVRARPSQADEPAE